MQYNLHNEKYKYSDIAGIHKEAYREYSDKAIYRNDVDSEFSKNNKYLDIVENGSNWFTHIKNAQRSTEKITGKALRKDAVCFCCTVESVPNSWPREAFEKYFEEKAHWFNEQFLYGKGYTEENAVLDVCIHEDESTPHAHMTWLPIKDGKLQARNIITRDFLKDLQAESQQYTFDWIDQYNKTHDEKLEELEPILNGSIREHLSNVEFKKQKLEESISTLHEQHQELATKVEGVKIELENTQQVIEEEKNKLEEEKLAVQEMKTDYESKAKEIVELTQAPDLPQYQETIRENKELKQQLTFKDKIIESLQQTIEQLKENIERWTQKVENVSKKLGARLSYAVGIKTTEQINEFPSPEVTEAISTLAENVKKYDSNELRVVPGESNTYRVVFRNGKGDYVDVKDGFDSRNDAEQWRNDFKKHKANLNLEDEYQRNRTISRN